jgi:hypothetical protein
MATVEQRDKRIATKTDQLAKVEPKLAVLNEKVSKFDERVREQREKLIARQGRADSRVTRLRGEIEWLKAMPIDGQPDPKLDEPDEGETEQGDESETNDDSDVTDSETEVADEPEPTRQRDPKTGHFLPVGASV